MWRSEAVDNSTGDCAVLGSHSKTLGYSNNAKMLLGTWLPGIVVLNLRLGSWNGAFHFTHGIYGQRCRIHGVYMEYGYRAKNTGAKRQRRLLCIETVAFPSRSTKAM